MREVKSDKTGRPVEIVSISFPGGREREEVAVLVDQEAAKGCDLVVLEANHDRTMLLSGPYPPPVKERIASARGHLDNTAASRAAVHLAGTGTRCFVLAHLSETNNTPQRARTAVTAELQNAGYTNVIVHTARQNAPLGGISL